MQLVEMGKLDLDKPVHLYVDPWRARQQPPQPALKELWGGNAALDVITARQLLQMRGGLADYDDGALFDWTLAHPTQDYLPEHFLVNASQLPLLSLPRMPKPTFRELRLTKLWPVRLRRSPTLLATSPWSRLSSSSVAAP